MTRLPLPEGRANPTPGAGDIIGGDVPLTLEDSHDDACHSSVCGSYA